MYKQLRFLTTMLLLAVCCGTWAEDYSEWPCSTTPLTTEGTKIDGITWKISSANTYSNPIRFYANTTITLTADADVVDHITKVVFQASSTGNYVTNLTNGTAKFDGTTVSGSANGKLVTWTPTTGSKPSEFTITVNTQTRMSDMTVYYVRKSTSNVQIPEFSPSAGEVEYGTSVSIIQANAHLIKYTLDESEPTWDNGKDIDSNPITITQDVTIKARAFDINQNASDVVTAVYTVKRPDAPTFSPAAGAVEEGTTVTISGRPTEGKIIYTTDDTDPSYSSNNGIVFADGDVITINKAMTIKAIAVDAHDFESSVASASYTIYDPNAPGTQNNPYTVAQALDASASTGVYVKGIISRIYSTSVNNNGQIRYYISDDGTTENEMNIYNGKGLNGADFTSIDDIQVGDVVVIFGDISVYQNANQMAANNYIVSLQRKQVTSIALSGPYPTSFVEGSTFSHEGIVVTATYDDNSTVDVTERATFSEPNMTQVGEQIVTVSYQNMTATYTITITEAPSHTATFSVNGETYSASPFKEGVAIVFPSDAEAPEGYSIVGWLAEEMSDPQDEAPANIINSAVMGNADVTYYALLAVVTSGTATTTTDVLNRETTGVEGNTYTEWSGKTDESGAVYAGQSAGENESIQLRSKNSNSGIVTTTSGGNAKKVTVVWNSNTASGRTLDIYGKETAYEDATDLYSTDSKGTKLGSIVCGTSTELTITGDYPFIGLRSNDGAMYLTSISIDWQTGTPDTYSNFCTTIPEPAPSLTINIASACTDGNDNYYGTFYSDKAYIMDDMLEGQVVSVDANGKLVVETAYEGGDIVPANTALLIYAVEPGSYNVYTTTAAGEDWSEFNMLKGTLTADDMTVGENCLFYRLTMHNGEQIGFWWGAENGGAFKPGANKAYLAVPANQAKDGFAFGNDGGATSISTIDNGQLTMDNAYNLQGQKVGSEYKGIVIVNGKKFINK